MDEPTVNTELQDELSRPDTITLPQRLGEVVLLVLLFFVYAGDLPPMVNEAHYLVKAKNFWQPQWCENDLFASSAKAHTTFYVLLGWMTQYISLSATAWIGRVVGWAMLAIGLQRLCWNLFQRRFVCLAVATVWIAGIEYGNLAGEWVVGGIEAKVPAYGFVLLGLASLVQRRWNQVWIFLGFASAFHVLSGGWSVIAAMIAWWFTERGRKDACRLFTPALLLGGAISLFGLIPAVALTMGVSGEDSTVAARIYTYFRIAHHLLPADFLVQWYLRHGTLILLSLAIACLYWRALRRHSTFRLVHDWCVDDRSRRLDRGHAPIDRARFGGETAAVLLVPFERCDGAADVRRVGDPKWCLTAADLCDRSGSRWCCWESCWSGNRVIESHGWVYRHRSAMTCWAETPVRKPSCNNRSIVIGWPFVAGHAYPPTTMKSF